MFGIPLAQCVENDRISRLAAGASPFRSRVELSGSADDSSPMGRHGSRASFSSLIDAPRGDEVCYIIQATANSYTFNFSCLPLFYTFLHFYFSALSRFSYRLIKIYLRPSIFLEIDFDV